MAKIVIHDFKDWLSSDIVTNPDFFNSPKIEKGKDVPSYRLVLCHALWKYTRNNEKELDSKVKVANFIEDIINDLDSFMGNLEKYPKENFIKEDFLELFPFLSDTKNGKERYGVLLVDKTGGTFPLVFYPLRGNYKTGDRLAAFKASVDNIKKETDSVSNIIYRSSSWDWMQAKVLFFDLFDYVKTKKVKREHSKTPDDDW